MRSLRTPDTNISETKFPYILHESHVPGENQVFPAVELSDQEDVIFRGYRRVQTIAQSMALLYTRYPSLQLIQDFRNFTELLEDSRVTKRWRLIPSINELRIEASQHSMRATSFPAFSTISQIDQARRRLAEKTKHLREKIDALMNVILDDDETKDIVTYIKQSMSGLAYECWPV